jgi:hypothetical protein
MHLLGSTNRPGQTYTRPDVLDVGEVGLTLKSGSRGPATHCATEGAEKPGA